MYVEFMIIYISIAVLLILGVINLILLIKLVKDNAGTIPMSYINPAINIAQTQVNAEQSVVENKAFCKKCAAEIRASERFCPKCGTPR